MSVMAALESPRLESDEAAQTWRLRYFSDYLSSSTRYGNGLQTIDAALGALGVSSPQVRSLLAASLELDGVSPASAPVLLHTRYLVANFGRDTDPNASMIHVAKSLTQLQRLVFLSIYLPTFAISSLEAAFAVRRSALPHVDTLVILPLTLWLVAWCPKVKELQLTNER
ncbi:hypothetical protein AC579_4786 [Pseudocercospora musae]|uniref:Uncharacterized protein n=1 Tax=Pseudocercospora musae TaxID=113226 RepID=A0A139I7E0_9PEZI|nr:hypothetical protein AC579_4786 [Pseudocercospora musae]